MSDVVLYRCRTPTNMLCPCGTVERRLRRLKIEHEVERVQQRRGQRPEIEELTRQTRVPVLVDGDEVIHDSKRIIEYLEWKYDEPEDDEEDDDEPEAEPEDDEEDDEGAGDKAEADG